MKAGVGKLPYTGKERGQAIVLIVLLLTALLGITAVAVDGGRLYYERRTAQNAADNAVLAAALALCNEGNAFLAGLNAAIANGYDNNEATNWVEINSPPLSGPNAGNAEYVEVIITSIQEASFAKVIYDGDLQVLARAVARCSVLGGPPAPGKGIVVLDESADCAFKANGNGSISVNGGGIYVASDDFDGAMCAIGNADVYAALSIDLVGGWNKTPNASIAPIPNTGVSPMADPLADLAPPAHPGGSCNNYSLSGNNEATIDPGLYCRIRLSGNADLVMNPGIYYIEGGDFDISGNGSLIANGVMIYMTAGDFSVTGNGDFIITAPISATYAGLMLYMDRDSGGDIAIAGNGIVSTTGTIYGANSDMTVVGNGNNTVLNAQIIVGTLTASGNGNVPVNYDPDDVFGGGQGSSIIDLAE